MKILYIMPFKIDVKEWHRTGDTNMARQILERISPEFNIDVVGNFSSVINDEEELNKVKLKYNINDCIDVSMFSSRRDYTKKTFQYLYDNNLLDGYDLIHIHNSNPAIISRINQYIIDKKVIFTLHAPPENSTFQFFHREDYYKFLNNPNCLLLCVSSSQVERCLKALDYYKEFPEGNPNISYILNGINTNKYTNDLIYDCGTIGRFSQSKLVLESLTCVAEITKNTGGKGFFVGSTSNYEGDTNKEVEYRNSIYKLLEENPQIVWIDKLSNEEIKNLLSSTKSYISLSCIETFGLTVCEALMQGTPCIGFNVNGIGEIIEEGVTGYMFNKSRERWEKRYKNSIDLFNKCIKLNRDSIRNRAIERFNIKRVINEHEEIYKEFIKEGK